MLIHAQQIVQQNLFLCNVKSTKRKESLKSGNENVRKE